jgi:hypothetical protein
MMMLLLLMMYVVVVVDVVVVDVVVVVVDVAPRSLHVDLLLQESLKPSSKRSRT